MKSPGKELIKPFMEERFDKMRACINENYIFLCKVVQEYHGMFTWQPISSGDTFLPPQFIKHGDISKLRSTMRQVVREWTAEGQSERDAAYLPLVQLLEQEHPNVADRPKLRVLCPVGSF